MEERLSMDRQGRIVIPARIRRALGLQEGGELVIRLEGSRIVLEPYAGDLERRVEEWASFALSLNVGVKPGEAEEDWKWMSGEYARRKLGLP